MIDGTSPSHLDPAKPTGAWIVLIPRAGVNEAFRFAVAAARRAGHQRPDKLGPQIV